MNLFKKATLATALVASTLATASPAMARDYYRNRSDSTGAAIAGGIIGLALGAIIASSANDRRDRDYRDYDYRRNGWEYRDGYYWDRQGRRFNRDGRSADGDYYARRGYYNDRGYNGYRGY
jgi:MFS family permease